MFLHTDEIFEKVTVVFLKSRVVKCSSRSAVEVQHSEVLAEDAGVFLPLVHMFLVETLESLCHAIYAVCDGEIVLEAVVGQSQQLVFFPRHTGSGAELGSL